MGLEWDWQGCPSDPRAPAYDDSAEKAIERAIDGGDVLDLAPRELIDAVARWADTKTVQMLLAPIFAPGADEALRELRDELLRDDELREATFDALEARASMWEGE